MINVLLEYVAPNQEKFIKILDKLVTLKNVKVTVLTIHKPQIKQVKKFLVKTKKGFYLNHIEICTENIRHFDNRQMNSFLKKGNYDIFIATHNRKGSHCNYHNLDNSFWQNLSAIFDMVTTENFLAEKDLLGNESIQVRDSDGTYTNIEIRDLLDEYDNFVQEAYEEI